jgi:hypothetical protein
MDWLTFLSNLVGSLAWPSVVIVLLIILRRQISALASRLEELTLPGGAKAKFAKLLDEARQQLPAVRSAKAPSFFPRGHPDTQGLQSRMEDRSSPLEAVEGPSKGSEGRGSEPIESVTRDKAKPEGAVAESAAFKGARNVATSLEYIMLANVNPEAAVLQAYQELESIVSESRILVNGQEAPMATVIAMLHANGALDAEAFLLYKKLRYLRDLAVHSGAHISGGEALEFYSLCKALAGKLTEAFVKYRTESPPTP